MKTDSFILHARDRRSSRRRVRIACEVVRTRDYALVGKSVIDLSEDGMQFAALDDVALGEEVQVFFRVPRSDAYLFADAKVTRAIAGHRPGDEGPAYGVRFGDVQEHAGRALRASLGRFPPTLPWRGARVDWAATVRFIGRT